MRAKNCCCIVRVLGQDSAIAMSSRMFIVVAVTTLLLAQLGLFWIRTKFNHSGSMVSSPAFQAVNDHEELVGELQGQFQTRSYHTVKTENRESSIPPMYNTLATSASLPSRVENLHLETSNSARLCFHKYPFSKGTTRIS